MNDLISRSAVLARFKALQEYDPEYEGRGWACNFLNDSREPSTEWYCIEDVVEDVPAVDAAPVVRCKDCNTGKTSLRHRNGFLVVKFGQTGTGSAQTASGGMAMDDLISRETALRCIMQSRENIDWGQSDDGDAFLHYTGALYRTMASGDCVPTVSAVPVVRCRDCVYYNTTGCGVGFGWCEDAVVNTGVWDDFYCANGERRV